MVWSEGNMSLKNPVTPPGIDPGTVRLVAQRLNHYATPGPFYDRVLLKIDNIDYMTCLGHNFLRRKMKAGNERDSVLVPHKRYFQ